MRLRCTQGSVRWVYPGQALRVVLEPNLSSSISTTVCIKPSSSFSGASLFVERGGRLELLLTDGHRPRRVFCFRADGPRTPAIYLQASPLQSDGQWSRRTMSFRYEVLRNRSVATDEGRSSRMQSEFRLKMSIHHKQKELKKHIWKLRIIKTPNILEIAEYNGQTCYF